MNLKKQIVEYIPPPMTSTRKCVILIKESRVEFKTAKHHL